jgi:prepilin peptidase CpaA
MNPLLIVFLMVVLIVAALIDVRVRKIPNLLTYQTMGVALTYHCLRSGWDGLIFSSGGLVLGTVFFILPYLMGGMGAGDAKLMGAVGAILGPRGVFVACLLTAIVGGFYSLLVLLNKRQYSRSLITRSAMTLKTFALTRQFIPVPAPEGQEKPRLCYGIAITLGTSLYILLELSGYTFMI